MIDSKKKFEDGSEIVGQRTDVVSILIRTQF